MTAEPVRYRETYGTLGSGSLSEPEQKVSAYQPVSPSEAVVKLCTVVPLSGPVTFRLSILPSGGPLTGWITIEDGEWAEWTGTLAMHAGDHLEIETTEPIPATHEITYTISGVEVIRPA